MNGGVTDDGTISDLPWAAVFDPVANARALSAIQARGFSAAAQLVDRFVQIAETSTNPRAKKRRAQMGIPAARPPAATWI